MFVCDELRTEVWRPNFAPSGQSSPDWTRVLCRRHVITNSLEWVEWDDNPVQVMLCDFCGHDGCATMDFVHVSRLDDYVLWTPAQEQGDEYEPSHFMRSFGALAIPIATWNSWPRVPDAAKLPPANHAAVADAWVVGPARTTRSIVARLEEELVGCDTLEKPDAIALVKRALSSLLENASAPFEQPILTAAEVGARIETLYFDGPSELDWPAFAFTESDAYIALDRERIVRI